jgi:hypothetical protein
VLQIICVCSAYLESIYLVLCMICMYIYIHIYVCICIYILNISIKLYCTYAIFFSIEETWSYLQINFLLSFHTSPSTYFLLFINYLTEDKGFLLFELLLSSLSYFTCFCRSFILLQPSKQPSSQPTKQPSQQPTMQPSSKEFNIACKLSRFLF